MTTANLDDALLSEIENLRAEIDILRMALLDGEQRNAELEAITTVAVAMNRSLELQEVVDVALDSSLTALGLEAGVVCLYDPASRSFMPASDRQAPDELIAALASLSLGSGPAGVVGESRSPLIIPDLAADSTHELSAAVAAGLPFFAGIPIAADDELLGVMVLLDRRVGRISADWNISLGRIGDLVGRAMANAQVLRKSKQEIVERMMGDQELRRLMARNQEKLRLVGRVLDALPFAALVVAPNGDELLSNRAAQNAPAGLIVSDDEGSIVAIGERSIDQLKDLSPAELPATVTVGGQPFSLSICPLLRGDVQAAVSHPLLILFHHAEDPGLRAASCAVPAVAAESTAVAAALAEPIACMLGVVELYAAMALAAPELPAAARGLVETTASAASRAADTVRRLVDSAGRAVLARRPLEVGTVLAALEPGLQDALADGTAVLVEGGDGELCVTADPTALHRLLHNLVANAAEAMPSGGELTIVARRLFNEGYDASWQPPLPTGNWVEILVSDTGHGIDEALLPRVWEPFVSSHPAGEARGLGLSQVRGLAHQHGGHVGIRSTTGTGTEVAVLLPILAPAQQAPVATPELVRGHGQAVLVIEADAAVRAAVARATEELGYRALEAGDTPETMTIFQRFAGRIAVVVAQELPEADTLSLLHELRRRYPRARAVQMTRHEIDPAVLQHQGWHDWVPRPPQLWELSLVLARAVGTD